jgi:hypothetical protein
MMERTMRRLPLLIGSLFSLLAGILPAQDAYREAGDPSARVARISYLTGTVSFQPSGDTAWSLATTNYPMTTGDRLYADRGARAELQVGPLALRVSEATDLTVTSLTDQFTQIGLPQGTLRISVYDLAPGDSIEIDTPRGALALLAVGEYRIDAPPDDSPMLVAVYRGTVQWTAGGVAQIVRSGQAISVTGYGTIQVASVALPAPDSFDRWSTDRDRRLASSASAQYVSRGTPGYADLDDAGAWQTDAQYGPVWYPAGVQADWAPYRYGRWVWIEPWGWNWVAQEPWGYTPFHYGRWAFVGSRWGWLPGSVIARPYYAPALVVVVDGSGFQAGAQAWFPLGPGEPYRPWYHSGDGYQRKMNVPTFGRVANITVTTNVTSIDYRNRRMAMTVVPTTTFRSGLPIARRVIPVTQEQIARAPIAPHPFALPGASAAGGGRAAPDSPRGRRPAFVVAPTPRPAPTVQARQPLIVRQDMPAQRPAPPVQTPQPRIFRGDLPAQRPAPPVQTNQPLDRTRSLPAPATQPVLITRRAPPPQQPPFPVRQQAMQPDAGRPLEPQQIDNLRGGKPAGPRRDPENPAHPVAPAPPPSPAATPSPRQRQDATPAPRQQPTAAPTPAAAPMARPSPAAAPAPRQRQDATPAPRQQPAATPTPAAAPGARPMRAVTPAPRQRQDTTPAPRQKPGAAPRRDPKPDKGPGR